MNPSLLQTISSDSALHAFFTKHDDDHNNGFITRLDRSPIAQKRSTFYHSLALNTAILCCLTILAILTIRSNLEAPYPPPMRVAYALTQDILLASASLVLFQCRLRYRYGFRETEIILRRSPRSLNVEKLTTGGSNLQGSKSNGTRLEALSKAATRLVNPQLLYSRPGAILSSDYWTLEYPALLDAYDCVDNGKFSDVDFDFTLWKQKDGLWTACELWRVQEIMTGEQESDVFENLTFPEKC
ncbi:hypothetical protein DFP72DRAFT_879238 [Ephemerocybe angulata]|uniref:Uncharacterized protein n=1 Tax=Ephemerocybe angulata TaxID=980116 RepID=A0A8H6ICE3_9AGAR|nr:hypothetical protein DFP72DRAFT_879238 [Tulosesus angulatus]